MFDEGKGLYQINCKTHGVIYSVNDDCPVCLQETDHLLEKTNKCEICDQTYQLTKDQDPSYERITVRYEYGMDETEWDDGDTIISMCLECWEKLNGKQNNNFSHLNLEQLKIVAENQANQIQQLKTEINHKDLMTGYYNTMSRCNTNEKSYDEFGDPI